MRIGCIGAGNMGRALIQGLVRANHTPASRITISDVNPRHRERMKHELNVLTTASNLEAATDADLVILAIKPQIMDKIILEIKDRLRPDTLVLSIAAGYPTGLIERLIGNKPRVIRAMPNIVASVCSAATGISKGKYAIKRDVRVIERLFSSIGTVVEVDESLMDAVTGLSGTGPMYIFIIIEALSDAGVKVGLGRDVSTKLAVQTVLGASKMVQETDLHPIFLKDQVTSPGGTAINALYSMEKTGLRAVIMDAVEAATKRSAELGKPFIK